MKVEPRIAPCVTRENRRRAGLDMIIEQVATQFENVVEQGFHREDGRPTVDCGSVDVDGAQLTPRQVGGFDDGDVATARGEQGRTNESADACTDHNRSFVRHSPHPLSIDLMLSPVHTSGHMHLSKSLAVEWRGRWLKWRNAVLASPKFQSFALRFPPTRPIARRRAGKLFDLVAGFTYSQILAACIATRLLDHLADGPKDIAALGREIDLPGESIERLLRGAAALDLVEPVGDGWALGQQGAALIGNRGIAEMVAHHHLLYADLADPVALLRRGGGGGKLSGHWHYAESAGTGGDDKVADYSALMAASQPLVAEQILAAYPFSKHWRLLDVGGGEGAFIGAVAKAVPSLGLGLFDLPAVVERARARLGQRADYFEGSFLDDVLPEGFDLITLVRVLHDHDDGPALGLLRRIHSALPPKGRLLVAEPMAQTPGAEASGDAYFGFYLLAMGSGRPRSVEEISRLLKAAGFRKVRAVPTRLPLTVRVMIATP